MLDVQSRCLLQMILIHIYYNMRLAVISIYDMPISVSQTSVDFAIFVLCRVISQTESLSDLPISSQVTISSPRNTGI